MLVAGTLAGVPIVGLSGRIHFYEGHPMRHVVFPARVLGLLGCRDVVVTNAAGGINKSFSAGDLMLISDHVNLFGHEPAHRAERRALRRPLPRHVGRLPQPTCELAAAAARRSRIHLFEGVSTPG